MTQINRFLFFVLVILAYFHYGSCKKQQRTEQVLQANSGVLVKTRNKYNQEVSRRLALVGTIKDLKQMVNQKDSLIKHLVDKLNKNTLSLSSIRTQTVSTHTTKTDSVLLKDTVVYNDVVNIYPEYKATYESQWECYSIKANKDSIYHTHQVYNLFDIEQRYISQGLLKPKMIAVEIVNHNPSTITVDAQSFLVRPKKENRLLWLTGCFLTGWISYSVLNR